MGLGLRAATPSCLVVGFRAIDRRVKVMGVVVGEVDLIDEDECGNRYSV